MYNVRSICFSSEEVECEEFLGWYGIEMGSCRSGVISGNIGCDGVWHVFIPPNQSNQIMPPSR